MADNIIGQPVSDVVNVSGIKEALSEVITAITALDAKIADTNSRALKLEIDAKNIDNLNALADVAAKFSASQKQMSETTDENTAATEKFGKGIIIASNELRACQTEIDQINRAWNKFGKGGPWDADFQKQLDEVHGKMAIVNAELGKTVPAMQQAATATNNFQINVSKGALSLQGLENALARGILRFAAYTVVIGTAVKAFNYLYTSVMENIRGTDEYIARIDKMNSGAEALIKSFKDLSDQMIKTREDQEAVFAGMDEGVAASKRLESQIKAMGVTAGKIYDAEKQQADARIATLTSEQDILKQKDAILKSNLSVYNDINKAVNEYAGRQSVQANGDPAKNKNAQFDMYNIAAGIIRRADITEDQRKPLMEQLQKSYDSGTDLTGVIGKAQRAAEVQSKNSDQALGTNSQDQKNVNTAFKSKVAALQYNKGVELSGSQDAFSESIRASLQLGKPESIDNMVASVVAKYKEMYDKLKEERRKYIDTVGGEDANSRTMDARLSAINSILRPNEISEQERLYLHATAVQRSVNSAGNAELLGNDANYGVPNYGKMTSANSAGRLAERDAEEIKYKERQRVLGVDQEEETRQHNERIKQIEAKYFQERLGIATEYFQRTSSLIDATTGDNQTNNSRRHFNNMTSILRGKGSAATKDFNLFKENIGNERADANIQLQGINSKLPGAHEAYSMADAATKGPLSTDAQAEADKQKEIAKKNQDDLYAQQAEQNHRLADLDKQLADKKKEYQDAIMDTAINLAKETVSAIATINDNAIAAQQQQLEIKQRSVELQSEQEIRAIDATAGFAITKDNEKAKVAAETTAKENELQQKSNQLALKKARADKTAAEASIIVNTATAIIKAFTDFPYPVAVPIAAILAATGAVQYAAAASAPLPQFAEGTPEGGTWTRQFIAGEAGPEVIKAPGESPFIVDKATIFDKPLGTHVTPIHEYAMSNAGKNSYAQQSAMMTQIYQTDVISKEVARILGDKFEEVGCEIVNAQYGSRAQIPNAGKAYESSLRYQYRLKN